MNEAKWYLRTQDETFGPETEAQLVEWARLGRIQPGQEVSEDNEVWLHVEDVPFLDMRFSIDIGDGSPRGPFNRVAAESLLSSGRLPPTATMIETRLPFEELSSSGADAEASSSVESMSLSEPEALPQPERPVEPAVEVPSEVKIVEKEVRVEVPVEKIVEKIVVDEARVKELEGLLSEERRHTGELQAHLDEAVRRAAVSAEKFERAMKDAVDRELKLQDQVKALEDELRRLPQAASEVADIQAAVYSIMTGEAEELGRIIEAEKREFEDFKQRHLERADHLLERRREMLKRAGNNIEDMTRKALRERPEDPRTAQLRKELEELRRAHEMETMENLAKVRELTAQLRDRKAYEARIAENMKDVTQLHAEVEGLREQLQAREKELVAERQHTEELRRQQATRQQVLMNRLAALESPSIGTAQSMETNQSREAKLVRLPSWMRLGK